MIWSMTWMKAETTLLTVMRITSLKMRTFTIEKFLASEERAAKEARFSFREGKRLSEEVPHS